MKKLLSIATLFIYLAISCGIVMQVHYCMGERIGSSIGITQKDDHGCAKCGMKSGKSECCHEEVKLLKLDDSKKTVNSVPECSPAETPVREYYMSSPFMHLSTGAMDEEVECPPDISQPTTFILHRSLRI
ncbi:MAG: hypothetical protein H7Y27_02565 [Gemmatimonadaceae bacterium]|nr:hypothetical protein [Chitinophagaceae bacterium]